MVDLKPFQCLVENGANIEFQTNGGATALMEAATNAQLEVMRYLIEMGAIIDAQDKYGETALMKAVKRGHDINVINYLINHGASISLPNKYGETALQIAKIEGHDEISEYLKTIGGSVSNNDGNIEKEVVVNFPEINDSGFSLMKTQEKMIITKRSCLMHWKLKIDGVIEGSTEVDANVVEAIFEAIDVNSLGTVKNLLNNGLGINSKDNYGWTPLMVAVRQNKQRIAEYLVENGADVNCVSVSGWTPLRIAASAGFISLVKLLLAAVGHLT